MHRENDVEGTQPRDADGEFDPITASALLGQSTARARRQFNVWPPLLLLAGAVLFPFAFGAVWWSVRGQHPFLGPSGGALAVMYAVIIVWIILVSVTLRRAVSGVGGASARQRKVEGVGLAAMLVANYAFQGALLHAGASHAIVYGIYPITAPFVFVGSAFAISAAGREDWRKVRVAVPLIVVALVASFTGPVASWLVIGVGIGAVLLALAIAQLWARRVEARP